MLPKPIRDQIFDARQYERAFTNVQPKKPVPVRATIEQRSRDKFNTILGEARMIPPAELHSRAIFWNKAGRRHRSVERRIIGCNDVEVSGHESAARLDRGSSATNQHRHVVCFPLIGGKGLPQQFESFEIAGRQRHDQAPRSRTPGPPAGDGSPAGIRTTPAASSSRWIARRLFPTGTERPASKLRTVDHPTPAREASSCCDRSASARPARHVSGVNMLRTISI